ncbi:MAG: glycoside hydrolase N-terminal domain-containing protein [Bacteroidales bacterium]|nr:glycoside hydrolase N-terminal domain-containing protein [Candidatus Physcousia equi]
MKRFTYLFLTLLALMGWSSGALAQTFKVSTNKENPEYVYNVHRAVGNAAETGNYWGSTGQPVAADQAARYAFFSATRSGDFYIYNVDSKQYVSYEPSNVGNKRDFSKMVDADPQPWKITAVAAKSCFEIQPYNASNTAEKYVNWNGGTTSFTHQGLGLWQDGAASDDGSTWALDETGLGYIQFGLNYFVTVNSNSAQNIFFGGNSGYTSYSIFTNPKTELNGMTKFTISQGEGKSYNITDMTYDKKVAYTTTQAAASSVVPLIDANAQYAENIQWSFRAKTITWASGKTTGYVVSPNSASNVSWNKHGQTLGLWGDYTAASVAVFVPADIDALNALLHSVQKMPGALETPIPGKLYNETASSYLNQSDYTAYDFGTAKTLIDVFYSEGEIWPEDLPTEDNLTYEYKFNGEVVATETFKVAENAYYPEPTTVPFGLTATKPEGQFTSTEAETKQIDLTWNLPFEYCASADNITKWYTLKTNPTAAVADQSLIAYEAGSTPNVKPLAVVETPTDAYLWAIVGDPINGFQFYNRAATKSVALANTKPCTLTAEGKNVAYTLEAANTAGKEYFAIVDPDFTAANNKYLNADKKNIVLGRWNNDGGSCFTVVEVEPTTPEPEPEGDEVSITYNYKLNGEVIYTKVETANINAEYPATVAAPYGITLSAKPEGKVTEATSADITVTWTLPFQYTKDAASITKWYEIHFNPTATNYALVYAAGSTPSAKIAQPSSEAGPEAKWAIIGNPFTGFNFINKAAGTTMGLSTENPSNVNAAGLASNFKIEAATGSYIAIVDPTVTTDKKYVNGDAAGMKIARWSLDGGSNVNIVEAAADPEPEPEPEYTTTYYIKNNRPDQGRGYVADNLASTGSTESTEGAALYAKLVDGTAEFNGQQYEKFKLYNVTLKKYVGLVAGKNLQAADKAMFTNVAVAADAVEFIYTGDDIIPVPSIGYYQGGTSADNQLAWNWNGGANTTNAMGLWTCVDQSSTWSFVNSYVPQPGQDIVYHFMYNGQEIATQGYTAEVGQAYPDFDNLPYGLSATKPEGTIAELGNVEIQLTWNLPFVYTKDVESITTWYELHLNPEDQDKGNYLIKYDAASTPNVKMATYVANAGAAYQWAIVGDPINGFNFYNKAAGTTVALSTANPCVLSADGKTANFKLDSGAEGPATNFSIIDPNLSDKKYINGNAKTMNIERWNKDGGSTIAVVATNATDPEPDPERTFFSTAENPVFWGIKFNGGTVYISDKGTDNLAETTGNFITGWAFIGDENNFKLLSTKGNYLGVKNAKATNGQTSDLIYSTTEANAVAFKLVNNSETTFEIAQVSAAGKTFNPWGGMKAGNSIGFWTAGDANNKLVRVDIANIEPYVDYAGAESFDKPSKHTLWYNAPAPTDYNGWQEFSLPIGNGEFGGSIFGGLASDKITFNEKSLWDGASKTRNNGPHGEYLKFGHINVIDRSEGIANGVTEYARYLDIDNAVAGVQYIGSDNNKYTRTFIASQPAKAIIGEYKAENGAKLDLSFSVTPGGQMTSRSTVKPSVVYNADGSATFNGKLELLSYAAQFTVKGDAGAIITVENNAIRIKNTSNVYLYIAGATDFDAWNNQSGQFTSGRAAQLPADVKSTITAAAAKDFATLLNEHKADYGKWMSRVDFDLAKDGASVNSNQTTNALLTAYTKNTNDIRNTAEGLFLEQLYYNFGRYLLISSNRTAPVPNNLQGLWVDTDNGHAPWNSDIHTNINIQMNYWPAEQNNLSELHMPLLNHIKSIAQSPGCINQAKTAGQTVGWVVNTESNLFGGMSTFKDNYTIANAWYCSHLWQHYRFTKDEAYLREFFPVMWSAAQYWAERMVLASDGTYECPKEWSPEHGPGSENATPHSQQLVNELFANTLEAIQVLGNESSLDATWLSKIRDRAKKSDSGLKIETYEASSNWGTQFLNYGEPILREWKYSPFTAGANGHRHTSHLMALYPFNQVSYFSPKGSDNYKLAVAARNSLAQRSDNSTGWAMGWRVNLWARTLDGDHARLLINNALRHTGGGGVNYGGGGVYSNLWDSHSPFQIDGNFGVCAGISEMLLQSYDGTIHLLPALPTEWADGHIKGLKAVGNFTVDQEWADGRLTEVRIVSNKGGNLSVQYAGAVAPTSVSVNGVPVQVIAGENGKFTLATPLNAGDEISVDYVNAPTSINAVEAQGEGNNMIFDLQGRRVNNLARGIYISNGKKVLY